MGTEFDREHLEVSEYLIALAEVVEGRRPSTDLLTRHSPHSQVLSFRTAYEIGMQCVAALPRTWP